MIIYDKLWATLKEKNISQYKLIKDYGIDKAQLHRLRNNMVVKTMILNRLCCILDCRIEDIMEYVPDNNVINDNVTSDIITSATAAHDIPAHDNTE